MAHGPFSAPNNSTFKAGRSHILPLKPKQKIFVGLGLSLMIFANPSFSPMAFAADSRPQAASAPSQSETESTWSKKMARGWDRATTFTDKFFAPLTDPLIYSINKLNELIHGKEEYCPEVPAPKPPPPPEKLSHFKTEGELIRYVTCYQDKPELAANYKKFIPVLNAAARSFGIPPALLTCNMFQESMFDPNARSETNAVGIAQFLTDATETVANLIASAEMSSTEVKRLTDILSAKPLVETSKTRPTAAQLIQEKKNRTYAANRLHSRQFGLMWQDYVAQVKSQGLGFKGQTPKTFNMKLALNPMLAIGASALYLRYLHDMLSANVPTTPDSRLSPGQLADHELQINVVAAGFYNVGQGNGLNAARAAKSQTPVGWRQEVAKVVTNNRLEGKKHMESIERCMTSPKANRDLAYAPKSGTPPRDCDARFEQAQQAEAAASLAQAKAAEAAASAAQAKAAMKAKKAATSEAEIAAATAARAAGIDTNSPGKENSSSPQKKKKRKKKKEPKHG